MNTKLALELALKLIQDTWPHEHGNRQVGEAWGALEKALEQNPRDNQG